MKPKTVSHDREHLKPVSDIKLFLIEMFDIGFNSAIDFNLNRSPSFKARAPSAP